MVRVVLPVVTVSYVLLLLRVLLQITTCAALSTPSSSSSPRSNTNNLFTEIQPLKAAMLTKTWQGLMLDVEEKVGVVPELGNTSVSIRRSSTVQMPRRQLCKQQFLYMYETSFALALADKASSTSDERTKKRETIASLVLEEHRVGPQCFTYASLTQPSALVLVVKQPQPQSEKATNISHHQKRNVAVVVWSILALTVNPTERNLEAIVEAERTVLHELYTCCCREVQEQNMDDNAADADDNTNQNNNTAITVRISGKARNTLAGTNQQLGLQPVPLSTTTAATAATTEEVSTSTPTSTTTIPTSSSSSASDDNPNTQNNQYAAVKAVVDFDEDTTVGQQIKDETQQQQQKQQPDQDQHNQSIAWFQFSC